MKKILVLFTLSLLIFSCSKEKRTINKLLGTWRVDKEVYTDVNGNVDTYTPDPDENMYLDFKDWTSSTNDDFNIVFVDGMECFYKVIDKGDHFIMSEDPNDPDDRSEIAITELSKKELLLTYEDEFDKTEMYLSKKGD